jgi:hypothetical protein
MTTTPLFLQVIEYVAEFLEVRSCGRLETTCKAIRRETHRCWRSELKNCYGDDEEDPHRRSYPPKEGVWRVFRMRRLAREMESAYEAHRAMAATHGRAICFGDCGIPFELNFECFDAPGDYDYFIRFRHDDDRRLFQGLFTAATDVTAEGGMHSLLMSNDDRLQPWHTLNRDLERLARDPDDTAGIGGNSWSSQRITVVACHKASYEPFLVVSAGNELCDIQDEPFGLCWVCQHAYKRTHELFGLDEYMGTSDLVSAGIVTKGKQITGFFVHKDGVLPETERIYRTDLYSEGLLPFQQIDDETKEWWEPWYLRCQRIEPILRRRQN